MQHSQLYTLVNSLLEIELSYSLIKEVFFPDAPDWISPLENVPCNVFFQGNLYSFMLFMCVAY